MAFTHAGGNVNMISNEMNKERAINSHLHLRGVFLSHDGRIHLDQSLKHYALKTIVQIQDVIPPITL